MKNALFSFFVLCLLCISVGCKKDNANVSQTIIGSWELRQTSGAVNPGDSNYTAGNGNIIKFTATGYEMYNNGQFTRKGTYFLIKDATVEENVCLVIPPGQFNHTITYDGGFDLSIKTFIQVNDNTLTFMFGCYAQDAGVKMEYAKL